MLLAVKIIYFLAVALFVALFFGFGIAAFYEAPPRPQYPEPFPVRVSPPPEVAPRIAPAVPDQEYQKKVATFEEQRKAYEATAVIYRRNVFLLASACGLATLLLGLLLSTGFDPIRSGLILGGTATFIYGVLQYWGEMDYKMRFGVVAIALALLLFVGYRRLVERRAPGSAKGE